MVSYQNMLKWVYLTLVSVSLLRLTGWGLLLDREGDAAGDESQMDEEKVDGLVDSRHPSLRGVILDAAAVERYCVPFRKLGRAAIFAANKGAFALTAAYALLNCLAVKMMDIISLTTTPRLCPFVAGGLLAGLMGSTISDAAGIRKVGATARLARSRDFTIPDCAPFRGDLLSIFLK